MFRFSGLSHALSENLSTLCQHLPPAIILTLGLRQRQRKPDASCRELPQPLRGRATRADMAVSFVADGQNQARVVGMCRRSISAVPFVPLLGQRVPGWWAVPVGTLNIWNMALSGMPVGTLKHQFPSDVKRKHTPFSGWFFLASMCHAWAGRSSGNPEAAGSQRPWTGLFPSSALRRENGGETGPKSAPGQARSLSRPGSCTGTALGKRVSWGSSVRRDGCFALQPDSVLRIRCKSQNLLAGN